MKKPRRPQTSATALPWRFPTGYGIAVALATAIAFLPALSGDFVNLDDDRIIVHNPYLHLPFADAWSWMWTTMFVGHYQPLTWWSLFVDARLGGFQPLAFHATNLLLHAVAAAVLAATIARLLHLAPATRNAARPTIWIASAAGALLWSIHPLRVESVAWISERRDVLSILFWLIALYAYLRYVAPDVTPRQGRRWYIWSCGALALSLLAKAWGMSFVIVLIVLDRAVLGRREWVDKIPYAALGAVAAVLAWFAQRFAVDTMVPIERWGWTARVLQACYGLCFYLWKTIVPSRLAALYELPADWHDMYGAFLASAVVVCAAAALVAIRSRTDRALAGAAVVYVVTLAPVLGFAQSGPQLVADRYAYVAAIPWSALVAGTLVLLARRIGIRRLAAAAAAVLVAYGVVTWRQTKVWHDSISLWEHALAVGQPSYAAHLNYGQALRERGDVNGAIAQYRLAVARRPDGGSAWYNLANALKAKGQLAESERAYVEAIAYLPWKVNAQVNLANLYFSQKRLDEAIAQYRAATVTLDALPPAEVSPEPYLYLGMALADAGDAAGARRALDVARRYPSTRARAEEELRRFSATETQRTQRR